MPVRVFTTPIPIILKGEATCATVSQYDKNGRTETTTLRFATLSPVPVNKHVAFIVTDTTWMVQNPYDANARANLTTLPCPTSDDGLVYITEDVLCITIPYPP